MVNKVSAIIGGRNATSFVQGAHNATECKAALLQLQRLAKMPLHTKRVLTAFLDGTPHYEIHGTGGVADATDQEIDRIFESDLKTGDPKAVNLLPTAPPERAAYDAQTGGVVMMSNAKMATLAPQFAFPIPTGIGNWNWNFQPSKFPNSRQIPNSQRLVLGCIEAKFCK